MTINAEIFALLTAPIGGEIVRMDTSNNNGSARQLILANETDFSQVFTLPDLGTGLTKTLWDVRTNALQSPQFIALLLDPGNVYTDNLSRTAFTAGSAPVLTLEFSFSDAVAGVVTTPATPANEAVGDIVDLYREGIYLRSGCASRAAINTATQNRALSLIRARSNMTSGFGPIKLRLLMFG